MIFNRVLKDKIAGKTMLFLTILACSSLLLIFAGLIFKSLPVIEKSSFSELLFSSKWHPLKGEFGMLPFISSTLWVTGVSIIIAVPLCILSAIYLSEYAHKRILQLIFPIIDILAGIPSVIFGVWGLILIVPIFGYSILSGGIVLAVMIVPVVIHVMIEVIKTVPSELRDASLSLGATKWQTIKFVVVKKALPGIIAGIVLGLSRAFGETMAVLMVVGNVVKIPHSVMDAGYPLPALIANNYGEMMSIPMYDSALMLSALILFIIIVVFNVFSRLILIRIERNVGYNS
ncbi:MAG: phosphate ABC transporter permease subunit PstC [Bacteroidetes bacterium]|nr:phosphate ABC transporter permease subunit PstC [Bacteroidota bacterium]